MKKFEDLVQKRDSEIEAERKQKEAELEAQRKLQEAKREAERRQEEAKLEMQRRQQEAFDSRVRVAGTRLVIAFVITLFSYYEAIIKYDGGLFTGFFMGLLLYASGIATIVLLIKFFIVIGKGLDG